jgi:tRNA A37 threonylcarbamoyladenosine dehydratase
MSVAEAERRFGGINRLYGPGSVDRLAQSHVVVIGIGGVGSWATEVLARSGVGRLTLIDLDHVVASNINRQVHALEATLGMAKVQAMRERILQINPECHVDNIEDFVTPENAATLLPVSDLVLDCIDQVKAKAALIAHCRQNELAIITTGGAGGRTDPTRIRLDDLSRTTQDALASKLRAQLRKDYGFTRDVKKKFDVPCVFSDEPIRRPASTDFSGQCTIDGAAGLACAGYGSTMAVTAGFGCAAAAHGLAILLR